MKKKTHDQQKLYVQAGRLLEFVDGQEERMLAVNARTGEFLVDNFDREGSIKVTGFNSDEAKVLDNCKDGIILIHNHSLNGRPFAQDMLTYLNEERVKVSLVLCHDGTMYGIYGVSPKFPTVYDDYLEQAKQKTDDLDETSAPYTDNENPFVRTKDDEFDEMIIAKYHLTTKEKEKTNIK